MAVTYNDSLTLRVICWLSLALPVVCGAWAIWDWWRHRRKPQIAQSEPPEMTDKECADLLAAPDSTEARKWLKADRLRRMGEYESWEKSLARVEEVYAAGATCVTAVLMSEFEGEDHPMTLYAVVTLPEERETRKRVFEWARTNNEVNNCDPIEDTGQKHILINV